MTDELKRRGLSSRWQTPNGDVASFRQKLKTDRVLLDTESKYAFEHRLRRASERVKR
ncbi:MAG: hypothetical protein GY898_12685 [Proteobacteria bacterium]|nr:hypothetical protein [Pseudomonadota bacterium]